MKHLVIRDFGSGQGSGYKAQTSESDHWTTEFWQDDFFIEEPEAHLFPSTQKTFVYSLVEMLNGRQVIRVSSPPTDLTL